MTIRAVVFDIGGVLEITPDTGIPQRWENRLGLPAGTLGERLGDVWAAGGIGTITEEEVHQAIEDRLGLDERDRAALMADIWREYLGTANRELIEYARGLRPRYRTGILSNSFVGARQRERLEAQPEETVFVDDTDRCVAGAREAGIHAIRYRDNAQVIQEIENLLTGGHPARAAGGP